MASWPQGLINPRVSRHGRSHPGRTQQISGLNTKTLYLSSLRFSLDAGSLNLSAALFTKCILEGKDEGEVAGELVLEWR